MRNNLTASMFDLSVKDKSHNPFGKLKNKLKGKNKDAISDSASAIIPSTAPSADSDDESPTKDKKKKSKIKTLFSKSNLQKTPLSQSMSVLPTSKSDRVMLRPGNFQSRWGDDDNEDESSSASDIMTHKRTASADPKQLNQINLNPPKKEGLSFLGGLRSKNDLLSHSNVCINGNHVYLEQSEAKSETKDSSPSSSPSPQGFRKKHLFSSTENLAPRSWREPGEADRQLSTSPTKDSLKSMSLPSYRPLVSKDVRENMVPANLEAAKETKESKKPENKKSSLLSLVTGKKDVAKVSEGENPPAVLGKVKEGIPVGVKPKEDGSWRTEDVVKTSEKDTIAVVSGRGKSMNPFEEVQIAEPEADPETNSEPKPPVTSTWAPQTKAVKPRLEVSPEAQPKARLPFPSDSSLFFSAVPSSSDQIPFPSELGHGSETQPSESPSVFSFSSPIVAPISTSTPIENWLSTDKHWASSEESSLLLKGESQKENLTQVPNTVSSASGSLSKQPSISVYKEMEEGKASEAGTENVNIKDSEKSLLEKPEVEQQGEELLKFSQTKQQDDIPASKEFQEIAFTFSVRSGSTENPAGKPCKGEDAGFEIQPRYFGENKVRDGKMTSAVKETVSPPKAGDSVFPLDSRMQQQEEMGLNVTEGQKKIKKRVSFSEQLFTEEKMEESTELVEEYNCNPQELREPSESPHTQVLEREVLTEPGPISCSVPASMAERLLSPSHEEPLFSEGPMSEVSSGKDTVHFQTEEDDSLIEQYQSKASDHEGLLSDPLSDLHSAPDTKSPVMADLNLSLPSIPEVTSDDERVEQVEEVREPAKMAALEVGTSSPSTLGACAEKEKAPSGEADGSAAAADSLHDFRSKAPKASGVASSEPAEASGIHRPHLGKSSSLDKQLPSPGSCEEEKLKGNGKPSHPPDVYLDPPVSSPFFSESFPPTHSFPSSPHSDTHQTSRAESQKKATAEGSAGKVENSGKRKPLLQAWVSPSETHPVSAQPSAGSGSAKHRLHPVKPMNTTAAKVANSSLGTATIISENLINEAIMKKYNPSDPAFAYAQLTHDELIQLVLKQKETISKKEFHVRELENYIDNLLVRVMEETPNILRIPAQVGKKAGKM
ncbi:rab11 family-interacting protein 1 isoform X2 [Tamandua tetradactyla]